MDPVSSPELPDIAAALERIRPYTSRTQILTCRTLSRLAGAELFFKCENFQRTGAFKARGAHNAVWILDEAEAARGVVTHSSGNHAAALALAAQTRGIPAFIVMPSNAPEVKKRSVLRYGGQISFCEPTLAARESAATKLRKATGATLIHPYDDRNVVAGQGTVAFEFLEERSDLDAIIAPVGGGGLLSGTAIAAKTIRPGVQVHGAEPLGADDAARSLEAGKLLPQTAPKTIADGLLTSLSDLTFGIIRARVDGIFTVADEQIIAAMRQVWEIMKIIIEPSAAVAVAAVLARPQTLAGKRVGVILSGGNVNLDRLPW